MAIEGKRFITPEMEGPIKDNRISLEQVLVAFYEMAYPNQKWKIDLTNPKTYTDFLHN